ncbi:MbnP family copper-binding protein [Yoonia sediminilitoris]|uniref:Putative repeat protein (TIGR04052 family) n=1 Tax=Yoonia sediminilitoris TaxID=1286148 RepID=A0A2T6KH83_9RHOB|nr:MbnP family copper-binding protein [Yoonia sediminilitoris]PUB14884.1 putative repeat protein (TIGR04052 family) [Yoonia sediminilitoris]RCW95601.1 putative repeat protein (TIGR04052 family) [Yoonia sediminilitoris]
MKKLALLAAVAASPALADQPVTINFAAEIGGAPFDCAQTYSGIGATGADIKGTDFRTYVSDLALVATDGTRVPVTLDQDIWQYENVALLDFEDATGACTNGTSQTNTTVRGTVPNGTYTGVAFSVGVPFEMNHGDPTVAPSPLNLTSMFWNWRGGYKFVRIDMVPTNPAENGPKGWFLHLGSTMCKAGSKTEAPTAVCGNPNLIEVAFDSFDPAANTIIIDPAAVVAEADLRHNTPETSPGCMSFPGDADCTTVMTRLGLPYGDIPASSQALFVKR